MNICCRLIRIRDKVSSPDRHQLRPDRWQTHLCWWYVIERPMYEQMGWLQTDQYLWTIKGLASSAGLSLWGPQCFVSLCCLWENQSYNITAIHLEERGMLMFEWMSERQCREKSVLCLEMRLLTQPIEQKWRTITLYCQTLQQTCFIFNVEFTMTRPFYEPLP